MKNVRKRFLSLIMAMMMVLSCVATASAADVADTTSTGDESIVVLNATVGDDGSVILSTTDVEETIMPRANYYINQSGENIGNGTKINKEFAISNNEKIGVRFIVVGKCHIKVEAKANLGGLTYSTLINETVENNQIWKISEKTFNYGTKVRVTLTFSSDSSDYVLQVYGQAG